MIQLGRYLLRQQFSKIQVNTNRHAEVCTMMQMVGKSFDELWGINQRLMNSPTESVDSAERHRSNYGERELSKHGR